MRSAAELKFLRVGTKMFIAANPVELVLIPRVRVTSGTGTAFQDQPARRPQTLCLVDQSSTRSGSPGVVQTPDGRERLIEWVLLGEHDAIIELYDYWTDASGTWEVAQVLPANGYEVRAVVVRHG